MCWIDELVVYPTFEILMPAAGQNYFRDHIIMAVVASTPRGASPPDHA